MNHVIAHFDLDSFFASVEVLDNPELRGKPVIVGGDGRRGVVASCTYEARRFGVRSAMSSAEARRLCPHAIFIRGNHHRYSEMSREVFDVVEDFTPFIERLGLDEAFLDITGTNKLFGEPYEFAHKLRDTVYDRTNLWCSIGISNVKFMAKLACEHAKPHADLSGVHSGEGVVVINAGEELAFLEPMPIRQLWGIGPATHAKLDRIGVRTVGDLGKIPRDALMSGLGSAHGHHLYALAHAIDERPIDTSGGRKSIGKEETFSRDYYDRKPLEHELMRLAEDVEETLFRKKLAAYTVNLKLKYRDFTVITRARTLAIPTRSAREISQHAITLLAPISIDDGIRLIGVSVSGLVSSAIEQLSFDENETDWNNTRDTILAVRERFGSSALVSARLLKAGKRTDYQWGPTDEN
jgi:DNA polymerase-4